MNHGTETTALFRRIEASFLRQGLMQHLGARLERVEPGICVVTLPYSERVTQQQGGFHGGAMGALADIACGYAAMTTVPEDSEVTTVEYKINFLAGFQGGELVATGRVVKAGKRIIVTSAEVNHRDGRGAEKACALMQQTVVPVTKTY
jgi:uncharacterized protein (TIGR00369 family)